MWPFKFNLSQQTISENFSNNLLDTLNVSCILSEDLTFLSALLFHGGHYYKNYSTFNIESSNNSLETGSKSQKVYTLNPYFITGFFDAEGCFMLSLIKDFKYKTGWTVKFTFSVVLHKKDIVLLESIKSALGGIGNISNHINGIQFRVRSKSNLEILIKFLDEFALISKKRGDYLLFTPKGKEAFEIYLNKLHFTIEGLEKLFEIKAILNKGYFQISDNKEASDKDIIFTIDSNKSMTRPVVVDQIIKSSHWLAGFTSGDGGFYIQIQGKKVSFKFYIGQHQRDKALLESFIDYLGCGRIEVSKTLIVFVVTKLIEIDEKIIPLFNNYPIRPVPSGPKGEGGIKSLDFQDFCEATRLIKAKEHLTQDGLKKIKEIKIRMNRNRVLEDNNNDYHGNFTTKIKKSTINLFKRHYSSICTYKVKILLNLNNPQVTKAFNSRVGTSEAIRLLNINTKISHNRKNKTWNEWLAGLIDGDGCFLLSKKGYASLEITMDIRDEHALQIIKNVYGGSIKLRSGANALRYRLHHKSGLLNLICDVNGHIRNSHRLVQLNKICHKYELSLIYPEKLLYDSAWFSGFFDADGTVTINKTNTQLSISASQKTSEILQPLLELYSGNIYIDRGSSQSFKWYITKREDILKLVEYFKINPLRSAKKNRLHLIPKYYELKDLNAHKALPDTFLYKSWQYFNRKWLKYEDQNN